MLGFSQGRAAHVHGFGFRNIQHMKAGEPRAQREINVIQIGEEIVVQAADLFERGATQQQRSAAAGKRLKLVKLPVVAIAVAEAIGAPAKAPGFAGAIENGMIGRPQQESGSSLSNCPSSRSPWPRR